MKNINEIIEILKADKPELIKRYGVKEIGVFGSYVRDEAGAQSDLDILVEFDANADIGLLKFVNMENHLSDILSVKVDLVMKSALKPMIGKRILEEVIYL
ncbi:MAG: nucleotidyltransferase family protein [Deltaproteobacteria bacterium]|nr:nucleotidyltransferase family protein [Deltaproteobacteria bacterium]